MRCKLCGAPIFSSAVFVALSAALSVASRRSSAIFVASRTARRSSSALRNFCIANEHFPFQPLRLLSVLLWWLRGSARAPICWARQVLLL
jgi:hypothetical protein